MSASPLTVPAGPSGRPMAQPMEEGLLQAFQGHITSERQASAAYFAMAIWCAERDLRGFCQFYRQEAAEEQMHAGKFADYLIARGQAVVLEGLAAPRQDWATPAEIVAASFEMEADVSSSLQHLHRLAELAGDLRTSTFLEPIIEAQLASEHNLAHLLARLRLAGQDAAALLILDSQLADGTHTPPQLA